jgi:hypothetical protein
MMYSPLRKALLVALLAAGAGLAVSPAMAADVNGRIKGTVTDPTNAVVPGAKVTATNLATGVKFTTTALKDGTYFFAQLPIGTYSITATASGFRTFTATGIVLRIDQEYIEPVQFSVGSASDVENVSADTVQVNTTDMQINGIVNAAQMAELPNIGRSFTLLETIQPGVQASSDRFGGYSVSGAESQQSSFLINGADTNDFALNTVTFSPNLDAIDEFNLVSGPLNPEYDRNSGGIVNATLKSGTNQFHGDAFEFYRDTFLNTSNFFQYNGPGQKTNDAYHQHIFGATIGGPAIKNKLFGFFAYQGIRQRVPGTGGNTTVFDSAQRSGNFSEDLNGSNVLGYTLATNNTNVIPSSITQLASVNTACAPGNTWGGCIAATGGVFPTSVLNPIASKLLTQFVPLPNSTANQYVFQSVNTTTTDQYLARGDYDPTTKDRITGIFIRQKSVTASVIPFTGASLPGFGENDKTAVLQVTGEYTRTISASLVNDFAVHYTRFNYDAVEPQNTLNPASFGFSINPQNTAAESLPYIDTGYFQLGFSTNGPQPRIDQVPQIDDSVSKVIGNHQLKFGYDGRKFYTSNPFYANNSGSFAFSAGSTYSSGDPGLDFLLGIPSSFQQGSGATIQAYAFLNYFYGQDTWKVTNNLTLNYGLGYSIDTPLHNLQYGGEAIACFIPGQTSTIFSTAPQGINYPGDPGCSNSGQATTRYNELAPRLGFAFTPNLGWISAGDSHKLSIRGGFGIYYNRTEEETSLNNLETPPFGQSSKGAGDFSGIPTFADPYTDINGAGSEKNKFPYNFPVKGQTIDYSIYEPLGINTYGKNFRTPYAENFQLSVEREFPSRIIGRLSYVGSLGRRNQVVYEGSPETQAGHDACLADTTNCGSYSTSLYRTYQSYFYPGHTQYGAIDPNTGTPGFTSIGTVVTEASSNYNSLQAEVQKDMTHGLSFTLSYTLSHALDTASSYENSGYGGTTRGFNQFNPQLNYGNANFDARQRLVFAPIYVTPILQGHSQFSPINLALSGWQVSGITQISTGFPYDFSYGGSSANSLWCSPGFSFYACPDEPNQVGPVGRLDPRASKLSTGTSNWFDAKNSGLSAATIGSFGNAARDANHGPGINNTNLIVAKNFNLSADGVRRLQIRVESDNVFNHTQFSNPGSTPSTTVNGTATPSLSLGGVGQITGVQLPARQTQLAAKFYF